MWRRFRDLFMLIVVRLLFLFFLCEMRSVLLCSGCDMGPSIKLFVWSLPIFVYSTFGSSFCSHVMCLFQVD